MTRIVDNEPVEVGHFIDQGGNDFWGVQFFEHEGQELVAASDRDFGRYIFRYTGNCAAGWVCTGKGGRPAQPGRPSGFADPWALSGIPQSLGRYRPSS